MKIRVYNERGELVGAVESTPVVKSDAEWQRQLKLSQYEVARGKGAGWPSFFQPVAPGNIVTGEDLGYGMRRTEILCARCAAHLGHVFDDGPRPSGLRFRVNSDSLVFVDRKDLAPLADPTVGAR